MTEEQLAEIFEEWQRRWQEDPESFKSCEEAFATPPTTYGESAAKVFLWILADLDHGGLGA